MKEWLEKNHIFLNSNIFPTLVCYFCESIEFIVNLYITYNEITDQRNQFLSLVLRRKSSMFLCKYTDHVQDLIYTGNMYRYIVAEISIKRKGNARARRSKEKKTIINNRSINKNQLRREEKKKHTYSKHFQKLYNCSISPLLSF